MKKLTKTQQLQTNTESLKKCYRHWKEKVVEGYSDPFYSDGVNLNLARNHIIYHREKIKEICEAIGQDPPEEVGWELPPEMDRDFMVKDRMVNGLRVKLPKGQLTIEDLQMV